MSNLIERRNRIRQAVPHLATASGSIASFQTDMRANLEEIKIHFNPQQASGTPSPSNVLPITGWTGLDLYHTGKNISPLTSGQEIYDNGVAMTNPYTGCYFYGLPPSQDFTLQATWTKHWESNTNKRLYLTGISNTTQIRPVTTDGNPPITKSLTTQPSADWTLMLFASINANGLGDAEYRASLTNIQVELGSTATEFEPYKGNQIPVSWSSLGTVYGGYVNQDGEVWANFGYKLFDGSADENWNRESLSGYTNYYINIPDAAATVYGEANQLYCDMSFVRESSTITPGCCFVSAYKNFNAYIGNTIGDMHISTFRTWLSEHNMQVAYKLATPVLVGTISPIALKTLVGANNIWANTNGNTEVKFWTHGGLVDKRTVVWNNYARPFSDDYWRVQDANFATVTINDGEVLSTLIADATQGYMSDIRTRYTTSIQQGHVIYCRQEICPSASAEYQIYFGMDFARTSVEADTWTILSQMRTATSASNAYAYFGRSRLARQRGDTIRSRNPLIIDITQMFGAGNEPSLEDFEALCFRNGINLNEPQPYNTGTEMEWYF